MKKVLVGSIGIFLGMASSLSHAGQIEKQFFYQKMQQASKPSIESTKEHLFSQIIDHTNSESGTFNQRYFVDETYGQDSNAPVFFYICGEAACDARVLNGALLEYAKKFNAKMVALEHRYYGESQPAEDLSTENLKYLTTDFALKDLANFQQQITQDNNWTGPWVAFGGSYPGSLSAYYRLQYPELVVGALASSAPVMAKEDFIEYDQHVTAVAGEQCANQIRDAVHEIEGILASGDDIRINLLKSRFHAQDVFNDVDFLYLIADVASTAVQYGFHEQFCKSLETAPDPVSGYAVFTHILLASMGIDASDMTAEAARSEEIEDHNWGVGMRQWMYQSCTEYGYWQNAHPDASKSTRSSQINLEYSRGVCARLFGMEEPAATDDMNNLFYMSLLNPVVSHIYFTNGTNDPWSNLSMTYENGNATNENLNYVSIKGASHCEDLHTPFESDSEDLKQARQNMESLLTVWLGLSDDIA